MAHPTFDALVNYLENRLPEKAHQQISQHLANGCTPCMNTLARLRSLLATTTADRTAAPQPGVLQQAVGLFAQRAVSQPEPRLRVLAKLLFDSQLQFSTAAVRGAAVARQMLFSTQAVDIDLQINPELGGLTLVGQILGAEGEASTPQDAAAPSAFVSLIQEPGEILKGTETDRLGQFTFRQIPIGRYNLVFEMPAQEIAIVGLELGK